VKVWWGVLNDEDFATVFNDEPLVTNTEIVTGNVDIVSYAGANLVQLANLREVGGALTISNNNPSLTSVSLPSLREIGGDFTFNNNDSVNSSVWMTTPVFPPGVKMPAVGLFVVQGNAAVDCSSAEDLYCSLAEPRPLTVSILANQDSCSIVPVCP